MDTAIKTTPEQKDQDNDRFFNLPDVTEELTIAYNKAVIEQKKRRSRIIRQSIGFSIITICWVAIIYYFGFRDTPADSMNDRVNQLVSVSNKNSAILTQLEKKITQNDSLQAQLHKKQLYIERLEASNDSLRNKLKQLGH